MSENESTTPLVATLAELDPAVLREQAVDAGLIGDETPAEDLGVVVLTEPERKLLQGLLIEAYDNLNGSGDSVGAARAKRISERLSGLA